jgi:predicted deacylase
VQTELSKRKSETITFDRYYRYNEINKYLDSLPSTYPNVKVKTYGKSYEGRDVKVVTITSGDDKKRNSVFIDGGIHAREWIAPATALYLIDQLLDKESNFSQLLNQVDFVIQPLVNPDGYEFSHRFYRLWRKTRSLGGICNGVDANRNYDNNWRKIGSSNNNCAETYHGPSAFSEKESQISRDVMLEVMDSCKFFLSFHSYGNYLLYPLAYSNEKAENWQDQHDVVKAGAEAIEAATGTKYTYGPVAETLYPASGSSIDYAYEDAKIPVAVVMELTGGGLFGFDLPASEIDKNVREAAIGVQAMVEVVAQKYSN